MSLGITGREPVVPGTLSSPFRFLTERRSTTRVRHQHDRYPHEVVSTALYGRLLVSNAMFTTVSRVRRPEASAIGGYQPPEVLSHFAEIREYLEAGDPYESDVMSSNPAAPTRNTVGPPHRCATSRSSFSGNALRLVFRCGHQVQPAS